MPQPGPPATTSVMATNNPNGPNYAQTPLQSSVGSQAPGFPLGNAGAPGGRGLAYYTTGPGAAMAHPGPSNADLAAGMQYAAANAPAQEQAPEFLTPAMQQYINQFRSSQEAQQQALNAGLSQALLGLGQRRDAAAKVAATLPGQYDQAFRQATKDQVRTAREAGSAFAGPTIGGGANERSNAARTAEGKAAGHANQPLLEAGIAADYSKGATTLSNTDMQNRVALAGQQQQFDSQMALAQAQWQQNQQAQQAGYAHDVAMAQLQSNLQTQQYRAQHPEAALTPQQQLAMQNRQALDQQAIGNGFTSYQQQQQAMADPAYQQAVDVLAGRYSIGTNGQQTVAKGDRPALLRSITNPLILKALVANGLVTQAEAYQAFGGTQAVQ